MSTYMSGSCRLTSGSRYAWCKEYAIAQEDDQVSCSREQADVAVTSLAGSVECLACG
jgi:hypothetical protein